jgi:UDP-glucuronate 4-epimerase
MRPLIVTGTAGFIGFHLAERLLAMGRDVVGVDVVNAYYDVTLKEARLARLGRWPGYRHERIDLADRCEVDRVFREVEPHQVVHLAAQAGVRHSLTHPQDYIQSNLVGFANVLEACRQGRVSHLLYASSSSVYGANRQLPFSEHHGTDHPLSLYAATKRSNELMAHSYAHLFGLPCTGLRFFTVYGPWGRPDMALFLFTEALLEGRPLRLFNHGQMRRDFTYIDDVVESVVRLLHRGPPAGRPDADPQRPDPALAAAPAELFNVGGDAPVELMEMVRQLEVALGRPAMIEGLPMQPGDVPASQADAQDLRAAIGFQPATPLSEGIRRFVDWYLKDYPGRTGR